MRLALFGPGRLGAALAPLLSQSGHEVVIVTREVYGDFLSPVFSPEAAACGLDCEAALLLPGRFELNADTGRMRLANAEGPIRLAEALHARLPRAHVIAFLDARVAWPEEAIPSAVRAYVASKRALADWVCRTAIAWGRATGARVNAIAPGPVLSPPDKAHSEKAGECLTPRPTVVDLHSALVFLLSTPSVTGQILYVAAGQQVLGGTEVRREGSMEVRKHGGDDGGLPPRQASSIAIDRVPERGGMGDALCRLTHVLPPSPCLHPSHLPRTESEGYAWASPPMMALFPPAKAPTSPCLGAFTPPSFPPSGAPLPTALAIAGSDSGGGAGIQADLRAFRDFGLHGCSAITALTAQNPHGVSGVMAASPEILRGQLERIAEDFAVGAVKTGMLVDAVRIAVVADFLPRLRCPWVVDPVMVATSGVRLLGADAVAILRERLLPHATLVTPNLPETQALLGDSAPAASLDAQADAARRLHALLGAAVLVKGGHAKSRPSADILCANGEVWLLESPAHPNPLTTHGTGCALSSAIAAGLALGKNLPDAVAAAKDYVFGLLTAACPVGHAAAYAPSPVPLAASLVKRTRL